MNIGTISEFKVSLFYSLSLKLSNSQLRNNKHHNKADFFLNILNRKLFARNFSTVLNLPRLHEQKEKTLLFFLDSLWDAEEVLRSKYCLIMILSFKKYLDNTVHSSPMKARMDLNLIRKYVKLILAYLKNALVSDIDRINSKFLIFFYFLTKTTGFLTKSNFVSKRKLVLRNLFFIFVLSKGRLRYFNNLAMTNNVISKSYASFLPRIKYASSVFPSGLFLVLYSPYKSSFNLGSSNRLLFRHRQFLQKLAYVRRLFNGNKLKHKDIFAKNMLFASRKRFFKASLDFSILKKKNFLIESRILYLKINKRLKLQKLKNLNFKFPRVIVNTNFPLTRVAKKNFGSSYFILSRFRSYQRLSIKQNFTRVFSSQSGAKFLKRLFVGLIRKLNFSAIIIARAIRLRFRNRVPRGYFPKLLKIFARRKAEFRQLYRFFAYAFFKINKQVFNSINKMSVLSNTFFNFEHFVKNASSFANFYGPKFYLFRKLRYSSVKRSSQSRIHFNNELKKRRFALISNSFKNGLSITNMGVLLKRRTIKQINSMFSLNFSFIFFGNSSKSVPFFSIALFRELKILAFSKFFNFRKFFDIFFFYLNLLNFIKISAKFGDVRNLIVYFPFFLYYGSQFASNTALLLKLLNNKKPLVLLDKIILKYKNLFNNFLKLRLFTLEQSNAVEVEKLLKPQFKKKQKKQLSKKLSKFKYIKKTPVQIFILERENLRNLEFLTGNIKKLVMKFKYFTRRKNDVSFFFKLKRKAMLAKKRAERLLAFRKNIAKKKTILKKVPNSPLFKHFETLGFKKRYAVFERAKSDTLNEWKREDTSSKILKESLTEGDSLSANYIHRFHFRKRISRIDYRRLKRKFFVNLLFFTRSLKQKRIAYNYYKIGKKSFKLSALQKISNPFFLRLKLKRYLSSDNYKKIVNRFSFLNSSYGLKNCISKHCDFNSLALNSINFFDSYLDKYKIVKFSFLKAYSWFFFSTAFYFSSDLVYNWLRNLKNSYLLYMLRLSSFEFSIYLNDYLLLLKFLFCRSGYFFFSNRLLILLADFKNLIAFVCKIKNSAYAFFFIFLNAFLSQKFRPRLRRSLKYTTIRRFYSTLTFCSQKKNNQGTKYRFFKFRFHFITFFKLPFSFKGVRRISSDALTIRDPLFYHSFANFFKIYILPCFSYKKVSFSHLNYFFQFNFLKSAIDFFPNIFLFSKNLKKNCLKHLKITEAASDNMEFFGIGFFSFLYSTLRTSKYSFFNKFFDFNIGDIKKPKIYIRSPYYKRRKVINKFQKFITGLMYRSRRAQTLHWKTKKSLRRMVSNSLNYRFLNINMPPHRLFKKYMALRVKRKILRRRERLLRKSRLLLKKSNFKTYKKPIYKKQSIYKKSNSNRKSRLTLKQKKMFLSKSRSLKTLRYVALPTFLKEERRVYGLTSFSYKMMFKIPSTEIKDKKKRAAGYKFASKSAFVVAQLFMPTILKGRLFKQSLEPVLRYFSDRFFPSKRSLLKKYFFASTLKLNWNKFLNSKNFIPKLFNVDLKFFNNFYNFSLSKINFLLINLKTQRFIRLLLIAFNQLRFNSKHLEKVEPTISNGVPCSDSFLENLFISDFFELSCLNLDFVAEHGSNLTLLDSFGCVFHTFFFRNNNNNNFLLCYFYNFCLLNFNYFTFLSEKLKDFISVDASFFELINVIFLFTRKCELSNVIRKKHLQFITIKGKFKSFSVFRSFTKIASTIKLFLYLLNYSRLQGRVTTIVPIKNFYHNFTKSFLKYLICADFISLKIKMKKRSRRSKPKLKRYLIFKTEFFLFLHSLFILFLEKFYIICEKSSKNAFNNIFSFVVNLFLKNLYLFSSGNKIFKSIIDRLFSRASMLNLSRFNLKLKLKFLQILLLNNQKFVSLFKNIPFEQIFFAPFSTRGSKVNFKVVFPKKFKAWHSKLNRRTLKTQTKLKSRKKNLPNNFKFKFSNLPKRFRMSSFMSQNLTKKIGFLNTKKSQRWNKYVRKRFFVGRYYGKKSKGFLARRLRRRLKRHFFAEFYGQFFEKQEMLHSQIPRLLLLRKAANLKLFYRYKSMSKTPKKRPFSFISKNELEPKYMASLNVPLPRRGSLHKRRRMVIKKKFHPFLKRKIIVGFFLSPRFLSFKNFSNSFFFMKVNFHKKIKSKLSLFLRLNRFMEFIFKIILRVKLYLKKKVFLLPNSLKSNLIITRFFSNDFYFYIVKVYRKLKLLTISFFNKLSIYFNKVNGFDDRLARKLNFRFGSLQFLFFYNVLSSKFLRLFVLRYFFFGYYIKYRFQFMNRFLWFRALPLNSFLMTPKVFIIITQVKNNFFITGIDLYGRLLYKTSPGIVNFTGSDRVSKYAWFEASVDFFDGFLEFFRYFLRSRKRKKMSYTLLRISREVSINFNRKKKKYGAFLHPLNYIFAASRKKRKKEKKRRLKSKVILRRFFVISKGVSDFHLRIFVKGMLNERFYVSKYFAGAVNYPLRSFSLCRTKKVRRV